MTMATVFWYSTSIGAGIAAGWSLVQLVLEGVYAITHRTRR